jgi:hypothetical protein
MNDKEILLDFLNTFAGWFEWVTNEISNEALQWRPDTEANNIALTIWHISRAFDLLVVRLLQNRPDKEQLWYLNGWADKLDYDPSGIGYEGFGNLSGYTQEEVQAVPQIGLTDLMEYFRQVIEALVEYLNRTDMAALYQPAPGWPGEPQSGYATLRNFLMDSLGHLGEIRALYTMWQRQTQH